MYLRGLWVLLLLVSLNWLLADDQAVQVTIDEIYQFSQNIPVVDAMQQAKDMAKQAAIEKALPQNYTFSALYTEMYVDKGKQFDEQSARSVYMATTMAARFIDPKFVICEPVVTDKDGRKINSGIGIHVVLETKVNSQSTAINPYAYLKVEIDNQNLYDGDTFKVRLTPSQDGYLYLFDIFNDNTISLIFPNDRLPEILLKKGVQQVYSFTAMADKVKPRVNETLYFILAQEPITGWQEFRYNKIEQPFFTAGEESFDLFQKFLRKLPHEKYDEKLVQLQIAKKMNSLPKY